MVVVVVDGDGDGDGGEMDGTGVSRKRWNEQTKSQQTHDHPCSTSQPPLHHQNNPNHGSFDALPRTSRTRPTISSYHSPIIQLQKHPQRPSRNSRRFKDVVGFVSSF